MAPPRSPSADRPAMPVRLDVGGGMALARATSADAEAMARAVGESLEHLAPFMPWADETNARPQVQHARLSGVEQLWANGKEFQFVVRPAGPGDDRVVGAVGLICPDRWSVSRRSAEIGYWIHVDWCRQGLATRSSRALTAAAFAHLDVDAVVITCDRANAASNAVPSRLGFTHERTTERAPEAPGESGHMQVWVLTRDEHEQSATDARATGAHASDGQTDWATDR